MGSFLNKYTRKIISTKVKQNKNILEKGPCLVGIASPILYVHNPAKIRIFECISSNTIKQTLLVIYKIKINLEHI